MQKTLFSYSYCFTNKNSLTPFAKGEQKLLSLHLTGEHLILPALLYERISLFKEIVIAIEYLNEPILNRTYGICQDVAFVCHPGQTRRECDPCAVPSARAIAKQQQIADMIKTNCTTE